MPGGHSSTPGDATSGKDTGVLSQNLLMISAREAGAVIQPTAQAVGEHTLPLAPPPLSPKRERGKGGESFDPTAHAVGYTISPLTGLGAVDLLRKTFLTNF